MKIIKVLSFSILVLCFIFSFGNFSYAKDYEHKSLDISANINIDGSIYVNETFTTNFSQKRHGIIRFIPLNYTPDGKDFHINVSNINVIGNKFTTNESDGNLEIKIGDANKTVIGEQIYPISYSVYGLIRNFSGMGYSELYWNLVGYDVDTNINEIKADIYLPKDYTGFTDDDFLITTDGTTKTVKEFGGYINWNRGNKITITYNHILPPKEGITLSIKFPNDYFEFDHKKQASLIGHIGGENNFLYKILKSHPDSLVIIICIIGGILLYFIKFFNNLPKIKKSEIENAINSESPIVVRYSPPEGINCAEAGMLYNCLLEPTDITSLLYKRTIEGFISISLEEQGTFNKNNGFIMTKLKNINIHYHQYEIDLFDSIFPGEIGSKKYVSTTSSFDVARCLKSLREYGKSKGWISVLDFKNSKNYIGFSLIIILLFLFFYVGISPQIAVVASFFIIIIFNAGSSSNPPTQKEISLTDEGKKISEEVIGYAKFIKTCDENKLRLFLKQDPTFFDKTLPYAVAFGFETEFIKKITPILHELDMNPARLNGNINEIDSLSRIVEDFIREQENFKEMERHHSGSSSTYDDNSGFDSGSSFSGGGSGFSSGGGGGGGGTSSW